MIDDGWIRKNFEESVNRLTEVMFRSLPGGSEKTTRNLGRISSLRAQIRTQDLPNTDLELYR
jgi:hypothetical protein